MNEIKNDMEHVIDKKGVKDNVMIEQLCRKANRISLLTCVYVCVCVSNGHLVFILQILTSNSQILKKLKTMRKY